MEPQQCWLVKTSFRIIVPESIVSLDNHQQCCDLLRPFAWAFKKNNSHINFSFSDKGLKAHANERKKSQHCHPTILGIIGTCWVVHANERNNCQHCWQSSKEVMHSGTIILATRVRRRFQEGNIVVVLCKRAQHCCATFHRSQNNRNVGTCCAKV